VGASVAAVNELRLIEAIERALAAQGGRVARWVGDDAAVVRARPVAVTSIDTVADGVHFERATHAPEDVGWKALAQALSDLAAMGAEAGEAYLSLALPDDFSEREALDLVHGAALLAERCGVVIAGGDVVRAPALVVTAAVTGWAASEGELVGRDGAKPGDVVGVTGALGGSGAGLLLLRGTEASAAPQQARQELVLRHRRPDPLLGAGRALAAAGARAMIDLSDGLATDARHLARRSGVALELRLARLPLAAGVAEVARAAGRDPLELAATAGDDYELLVAASPERRKELERAAAAARTGLTWLGTAAAGSGVAMLGAQDEPLDLTGYRHAAEGA
jgi:thiamine-monophosphate kinase